MPSAKILVVDDDPDFVEIMRTVLESADYQVVSASNSAEALKQIRSERPDLMLLDIMMTTVTDGLNLSEQLSQDPSLRYLPIIMITSIAETPHAGMVSMDEAIHMEAWISKPVDPKHLLQTVHRVLEETI
jgi:CheY-like chemotaxis protein